MSPAEALTLLDEQQPPTSPFLPVVKQISADQLLELCRAVVAKHPQIVQDIRDGKVKAVGALVGQARRLEPNANPARVREICLELIAHSG